MTAMETRISPALEEWMKFFSSQMTETYTSSVTFIKQLTIVAVSTITYLKNIFHGDNYTEDLLGGTKITVLKEKCEDELAQFIITALTQAFDAFEKKYLHKIALCFYEETCSADNLLEYHEFEYTYKPEGASVRVSSGGRGESGAYTFATVRDRTQQLLRACMVMMRHGTGLPETFDVGLRLYYNDETPEGYQAPGFCPELSEEEDVLLQTAQSRVKLGGVCTPFHSLVLHSYLRETRGTSASCEPQVSQTPASQLEESASEPGSVRCECGRADRPNYIALLVCRHCGYRQHAACYGLRRSGGADVPSATHCCLPCAERTGDRADPGLAGVSNRSSFAIFRRALWWVAAGGGGEGSGDSGRVHALCGRALSAALALDPASTRKLLRVLRAHHLLAQDPPDELRTGHIPLNKFAFMMGKVDSQVEDVLHITMECGRNEELRRRALVRDSNVGSVNSILALPYSEGAGMLYDLVKQTLKASDSTTIEVVTYKLESLLERYFVAEPPEIDVATRLVEESLSQRSNSDPLSEVLSPLERVSLQAGSRVDAPPAPPQPVEAEPSMGQYRSAVGARAGVEVGAGGGSESPLPLPVKARKRKGQTSPRTGVKSKKFRGPRY